MQPTIKITDTANAYIKQMLEKKRGAGFRLSVKKSGCSGFSYAPSIVTEAKPSDMTLVIGELTIYLDAAWLDLFQNLCIDYIEDNKTGIKQKRLVFINPQEASRCGCGESFQVSNNN